MPANIDITIQSADKVEQIWIRCQLTKILQQHTLLFKNETGFRTLREIEHGRFHFHMHPLPSLKIMVNWLNWYQTVELRVFYHQISFHRNWFLNA